MKIKNLTKSLVTVILGATMSFSAFAFVGCDDGKNDPPPSDNKHTEHQWSETYTSAGDDGHYQTCTVDGCEEHSAVTPHEYDGDDDATCNKCDYEREIKTPDEPIDPTKATIELTVDKTQIKAGTNETVSATVTITGLKDTSVTWTVEGDGVGYVEISQTGVLSLKSNRTPQLDTTVKIVATSNVSSIVKKSVTVTILAQKIPGQVGDLKTEMFEALGNSQITVSGEVSDVYDDFNNDNNDVTQTYDYKVMMSDGAWYGEWNRKSSKDKEISNYRRSENTVQGSNDHTLNQVFIDKDNKVAQKVVTDYNSVAALWENQHLWNHLAQLGTDIENQWEYDAANKAYMYIFDNESVEDLYLRTYLAFSLTPMLDNGDTLESIALFVEGDGADKKITKMVASTTVMYYGAEEEGSSKGATAMSYTLLTANFTDIGDTDVPDPTPYEATRHGDVLQTALENMGDATNYTFRAVETVVSAPSYDDSDYSDLSAGGYRTSASNSTSANGTLGLVGQVTADAILLARTGQYNSSLDGNNYWTQYSGYKQINETTYDYFEYSSALGALAGTRQYKGNIFDKMPKFEFSANIFEYGGMAEVQINGEWVGVYNFTLREPAVTRDLALQVSAHSYAKDAKGSTFGTFKITVTEDGKVVSTEYPYNVTSGTYLGIIKTTYSNIGTTALAEDTFDEYAPRVIRENWSQFNVRYYYPGHSTHAVPTPIDAGTLLTNIFGDNAADLPSPVAFYNAFEDTMTDVFFEWETEDNTATGGDVIYRDYVSFNLSVDDVDENSKITREKHNEIIAKLTEELAKYGFTISAANTAETYWGDNYTTYVKGNIMIRVMNNRTRYFFIDIMPVGMWTYDSNDSVAPAA